MIQEIKIRNFKSFRDEVVLSFETSGNDDNNSTVTMHDGTQLLRFAVVLGANASGKSNLLEAIEFLRLFWNTIPDKNDDGVDVQPFLMLPNAMSRNTQFEVKLYIDGVKYVYALVVNPEKVVSESLIVYLTKRPTKVFSRDDSQGISKITFNNAVVKISSAETDYISINCLRNMSLLAVMKKVNLSLAYIDNFRRWIDTHTMPLMRGVMDNISQDTKSQLEANEDFKQYLMRFIKEADFNISDIKIKKMMALFGHTIQTENGEEHYVLPETMQSAGTTRVVELESLIYSLLQSEGLMCIDEVESSLHPHLMEFMLMKFLNQRNNRSQLIVTTHYDPILKSIDDLFGKDSVWFTEKAKDGNSTIYSLIEFNGLNKLSSIHRAYMNGQFGALPNVMM